MYHIQLLYHKNIDVWLYVCEIFFFFCMIYYLFLKNTTVLCDLMEWFIIEIFIIVFTNMK